MFIADYYFLLWLVVSWKGWKCYGMCGWPSQRSTEANTLLQEVFRLTASLVYPFGYENMTFTKHSRVPRAGQQNSVKQKGWNFKWTSSRLSRRELTKQYLCDFSIVE